MNSHLTKPAKVSNGISLYFTGDIAVLVMDRGENRLNSEFCETMLSLLDEVESNELCKGVITTGSGKFYSNGLDLEFMSKQADQGLAKFFHSLMALLKRILMFPLPTLAAINGHCYAGGALIACAHDFRTMRSDRGWFCFNEVFINRQFSSANYKMLRAKFGSGRTSTDAIIMGRRYNAAEAFESGILHAMPGSQVLLIPESIRLMKSYYGKNGYPRESLANLKGDMFEEVGLAYDVEMKEILGTMSKL